jgi:hypothetical protein
MLKNEISIITNQILPDPGLSDSEKIFVPACPPPSPIVHHYSTDNNHPTQINVFDCFMKLLQSQKHDIGLKEECLKGLKVEENNLSHVIGRDKGFLYKACSQIEEMINNIVKEPEKDTIRYELGG